MCSLTWDICTASAHSDLPSQIFLETLAFFRTTKPGVMTQPPLLSPLLQTFIFQSWREQTGFNWLIRTKVFQDIDQLQLGDLTGLIVLTALGEGGDLSRHSTDLCSYQLFVWTALLAEQRVGQWDSGTLSECSRYIFAGVLNDFIIQYIQSD